MSIDLNPSKLQFGVESRTQRRLRHTLSAALAGLALCAPGAPAHPRLPSTPSRIQQHWVRRKRRWTRPTLILANGLQTTRAISATAIQGLRRSIPKTSVI